MRYNYNTLKPFEYLDFTRYNKRMRTKTYCELLQIRQEAIDALAHIESETVVPMHLYKKVMVRLYTVKELIKEYRILAALGKLDHQKRRNVP